MNFAGLWGYVVQLMIDSFGRRAILLTHLVWNIGILTNELSQFLGSKAHELEDLKEEILKIKDTLNPWQTLKLEG